MTISFDARDSYDPDGKTIVSYTWDFGDGATGSGMQVSHTYTLPGYYEATLTVIDADGERSTKQIPVAAYDATAPACGELAREFLGSPPPQDPAIAATDNPPAVGLQVQSEYVQPALSELAMGLESNNYPFDPFDADHLITIGALDDMLYVLENLQEAFVFVQAEQLDGTYKPIATKKTELVPRGDSGSWELADISLPYDSAKMSLDSQGDITFKFLTVMRSGCFSTITQTFHYSATGSELFHWRPTGMTSDEYASTGRIGFAIGWAPVVADFGPSPLSPLTAVPATVSSDWETSWSVAVDCYEDPDQPECPPQGVLDDYLWPGPQIRCGFTLNEDKPIHAEPMPIMEVHASSLIESYMVEISREAKTTASIGLEFDGEYFNAGGSIKMLSNTFSAISKAFDSDSHQAVALLTNFEIWDEWCEVSQGYSDDEYRYYVGVTEVVPVPLGWSGAASYPEVDPTYCGHESKYAFPLSEDETRKKKEGHSSGYEGQIGIGYEDVSLNVSASSEWGEGYQVEYKNGTQKTWDCGVNVWGTGGPNIFNASHVWTSNTVRDCEDCQPGE